MKIIVSLIFTFCLISSLHAQDQSVYGFVYESGSKKPIENVNVIVGGQSNGSITDSTGFFKISVNSFPGLLYFSHLNYGIVGISVSESQNKPVEVFLEQQVTLIDEVQIKAERITKLPLGDTLNVVDYAFVGNNRILLVANPYRRTNDQRLYLTDLEGLQLYSLSISGLGKSVKMPQHMYPELLYLFNDCNDSLYVLTKGDVRQISISGDSIVSPFSIDYADFLSFYLQIKAIRDDNIFVQSSSTSYNKTYKIHPDSSRPELIKTVYDPHGAKGLNCRYIYPPPLVVNKQVFRNVNAPLVKFDDQLMIFDFFENCIECFDYNGKSVKTIPIDFHLSKQRVALFFEIIGLNQNEFNQEIIQDKATSQIYVLFNKPGKQATIKELSIETGKVIKEFDFPQFTNIEKVKVHDSSVYFTYHSSIYPFYTNLYRLKL